MAGQNAGIPQDGSHQRTREKVRVPKKQGHVIMSNDQRKINGGRAEVRRRRQGHRERAGHLSSKDLQGNHSQHHSNHLDLHQQYREQHDLRTIK
jgi:hypothetical protein